MATDFSKYGVVKTQATSTAPVSGGAPATTTPKKGGTDFSKYGVVKSAGPTVVPGTEVKAPLSNRIAEGLGFGGAVDTFSSMIARGMAKPEEKQFIEDPTFKQTIGAIGQVGSLALPVGNMARGATALFKAAGLGGKTAATLGNVGAGATTGYAQEATGNLAEGKTVGESLQPGALTAIGAGIPLAGPLAKFGASKVADTTKFSVGQATGLSPQTIDTIINNPKALSKVESEGLDRASLANDVKSKIDQRLEDLSETGKGYEAIKTSGQTVNLGRDIVGETISKYGLKMGPDGKIIRTAESVPLKSGDIRDIEDFVSQYGGQPQLSSNAFLNARKALSNLSSFGQDKSDIASRIARDIRSEYDKVGKAQIKGLADLDAKYAPETTILKQIKKDYLTPTGELKDAAITKIANLGNLGRDKVLARLEKVVPDIRQRVQLLKALEDIEATKGNKVGTYLRGGVGGFAVSGGNPIVGMISAIVASPSVAVPILKAYGATKGVLRVKINQIIGKISTGSPLNATDTKVIKDAVEDHATKFRAPGDILAPKVKGAMETVNKTMAGKGGLSMQDLSRVDSKTGLPLDRDGFIDVAQANKVGSDWLTVERYKAEQAGNTLAKNFPDRWNEAKIKEVAELTNTRRANRAPYGSALKKGPASMSSQKSGPLARAIAESKQVINKPEFKPIREVTPEPSLSLGEKMIEKRAIDKIKKDPQGAVNEYMALKGTDNGRIVNTDEARKIFKKEGYSGANARAVQEPASAVSKAVYLKGLENPGKEAVLYAGGSGTGKTSAVRGVIDKTYTDASVILDGNLSSMKSALARVKEAQDAGKKAHIVYVYRDPVDSWENGVIARMLNNADEGGRLVPSSVMAENHVGSYEVIKKLKDMLNKGELKDIKFTLIDNTKGPKKAAVMSEKDFYNVNYPTPQELRDQFVKRVNELKASGIIKDEKQYKGLLE